MRAYLSTTQIKKKQTHKTSPNVLIVSKMTRLWRGASPVLLLCCALPNTQPGFIQPGLRRRRSPAAIGGGGEWGGGRRRCGLMEKRGAITPPSHTKRKKKRKLTLCFDGITPTERLYGNTCQRETTCFHSPPATAPL